MVKAFISVYLPVCINEANVQLQSYRIKEIDKRPIGNMS